MERVPFHPLLLAAFPVLFLWGANVTEVAPGDVWGPLLLTVLGVIAVWLVAGLLSRDHRRGALVASALAAVALSYGHVASDVPPALGVAVAGLLVAAAVALVARATDATVRGVTAVVNVLATVLAVMAVVPLLGPAFEGFGRGATARAEVTEHFEGAPDGPARDIYYVVLDRYPREDTLLEVFDYDNSAFLDGLEADGFDVADDSLAPYPKTAHSLAASLNLTFLDQLEETVPDELQDSWGPVYQLLDDHRLGAVLTEAGYEYLHLGTWWEPTRTSVHATRTLTFRTASEFSRLLASTTVWPALRELTGSTMDRRELIAAFTEHQFDVLDELADDRDNPPRFVFAHLAVPHEPYVFDADGSFVPEEVEAARDRRERFVPQVEYTNRRIAAFVEQLLADRAEGAEPIVVLQADEGPHPVERVRQGPPYRWDDAPLAELREKLRILNAYHLPGLGDDDIPEDLSPVNTFRLVLSHYFGMDLEPLPNRAYVFPHEGELYRYTDVTERVRSGS